MPRWLAAVIFLLVVMAPAATAATLVDMAGRTIQVPERVDRIVLSEGRTLVALGILNQDDPAAKVVGMMGDFALLDPTSWSRWLNRFPRLAEVTPVGKVSPDSFSAERAIALDPDLAIFGLAGHGPGPQATELIAQLEAAGVTVVFIDFFVRPLVNTPRSITLLGSLLGQEDAATAFVEAYNAELARVRERVARAHHRPLVFLENRAGLQQECCPSVGDTIIGGLVAEAGGRNQAGPLVPGAIGTVSLEYLLIHQPDIYVGTAIGHRDSLEQAPDRIALGPGVSADVGRASLRRSLARPGVAELEAVRSGRAYAIWHHFLQSPFNILAVMAMASWFQPELCADLDAKAVQRSLFARFQPVALDGTYWVGVR